MKKNSILVLAFLFLVSLALPGHQACADDKSLSRDITLTSLGYREVTVHGWYATLDLWFPGPSGGRVVEGSYLNLIFSHTPLLLGDRSALTVEFNGTPVTSVFLTPENVQGATLRVPLLLNLVSDKWSRFKLTFYMRISDRDCVEMDERLAWATVSGDTFLHYEFDPSAPPISLEARAKVLPSLGEFPLALLEKELKAENRLYFALPEYPTARELNAAFALGLGIGQVIGGRALTTTVVSVTELDAEAKESHLILVGRGEALGGILAELEEELVLPWRDGVFLDPVGNPLEVEVGLIQEVASPWQEGKVVLVVSGGSDEGVLKAALALASRAYRKLLGGTYAIIPELPKPLPGEEGTFAISEEVRVTFAELGYKDLVVSGKGEHVVTIPFFSTANPAVEEGLTLDLIVSHSNLLDPKSSMLRVELNGIPLKGIDLDPAHAERMKLTVTLPTSALVSGDNSLSFRVGLLVEEPDEWCRGAYWDKAWAVMHSDSAIYLAPPSAVGALPLDLSTFPYPWIASGRLRDSILVLPDGVGVAKMAKLVDLAVELGRLTWYDYSDLPTYLAHQVTPDLKESKHLILYGLSIYPFMQELGDEVPLRFGPEGHKLLQGGEELLLEVDDRAGLGVMELLPSAWAEDRAILIFTGSSLEALGWVGGLPNFRPLSGNLAVIDNQSDVQTLDIGRPKVKPQLPQPPPPRLQPILILVAAMGALVIAGVIFVIVRGLLQRREGEETGEI